MEGTEAFYALIRVLTCGIWIAAAAFKIFHFQGFVDKLIEFRQPFPGEMAAGVVLIELIGAVLVIANQYVWAVAIAWIAFIVYGTYVEHRRVVDGDGAIVFTQYVHVFKNVSLIGGLLALLMLDSDKPDWLRGFIGG